MTESFETEDEKETTIDPTPVEPTPENPVVDNPETPSEPIVDNTTDDTTKKDTSIVENANTVETVWANIKIIDNTGNLRKFVLNKRFIANIARTFKTDNYSVLYNIGLNGLEDKIVKYHIDGKTKLTYKTIDDPNDNQDDTLAVSSDIKANNGTTLEEFAEIYGTTVENFVIYLGTIKAKDLVK